MTSTIIFSGPSHPCCSVCCAFTEANLLFGRGMIAGIDRREQKKQAATVERDMLNRLRGAAGIAETAEMRAMARARDERADKYEGFDMNVRRYEGLLCAVFSGSSSVFLLLHVVGLFPILESVVLHESVRAVEHTRGTGGEGSHQHECLFLVMGQQINRYLLIY